MRLVITMMLCSFTALAAIEKNTTFKDEYTKAKNESLGMSERWSALQRASNLAEGEDFSKIQAFADSKDWYMRNASLVALGKADQTMAFDQAKKLISDKALVVRSAAADVLAGFNSDEVKRIFSAELDKKYNFNGKRSLWIRKQMMSHLIKNPAAEDRGFFVKYLNDQDLEIAELSTKALEKITSIRFTGAHAKDLVQQWKQAARTQKW